MMEINKSIESKRSFRERANSFLTGPFFIIEVLIITTFLMIWIGGPAFLLGLAIALITFWSMKWDWSYFGLGDVRIGESIRSAIGYVMIIIILNDMILEPLTEMITNESVDLSGFEALKGNLPNFLIALGLMWIVAGFGEEFFYRGYFMKRIAHLFGNKNISWIAAAFLSAIVFGLTHGYQGISGIITTGIVGFILSMAFFLNRNNLLIAMLTHGIYDTYGLLLIYLDKNLVLKNIMIEFYQSIIK
ncbi:MAG: hypothetical protein C0598_14680 [Marinilabiliales bacterium]|nr:MAG: hypothetical protein C0598_14680 [Marinilabiliales bacterium]